MADDVRKRSLPKVITAISCALALIVAGLAARPFILDELAIRKLASPDENRRKEAAAWLAERECVRAIPALLAVAEVKGRRVVVRNLPAYVEGALDRLVSPRAAAIVTDIARNGETAARYWALEALPDTGNRSEEALQVVAAAMQVDILRLASVAALEAFGQRAVPHIAQSLRASDMTLACVALSYIGPAARTAAPDLLQALSEPIPLDVHDLHPDPQKMAAFALWALGEDMMEVDVALLEHADGEVRAGAASRLGHFLSPRQDNKRFGNALGDFSRLPGQAACVRAVLGFLEDSSRADQLLNAAAGALSASNRGVSEGFLCVLAGLDAADSALIEKVRPFLDASNSRMRLCAARVLMRAGPDRDAALTALSELAAAGDVEAIDAFAEAGPDAREASPLLERLLEDGSTPVRTQAAIALARVDPDEGTRSAARALFYWLRAKDDELHAAAARALESLAPDARSLPLLTELLADPDSEVRSYAALLILKVGDAGRPAMPALRTNLDDPEYGPRGVAALTLYLLGEDTEEVRSRLFESASGRRSDGAALAAFQRMDLPPGDPQRLLSLISRRDAPRAWRQAALGQLHSRRQDFEIRSIPAELLKLLRNPAARVTTRMQAALAAGCAGPAAADLVPEIIEAASAWGAHGPLASTVARIGPACVPHLVKALADSTSVEMRAALALALGRMGAAASAAAPALARILDDPDPAVTITAVDALGRMGRAAEPSIARLEALATSMNPELAKHAAAATRRIAERPDGFASVTRQYAYPVVDEPEGDSRLHQTFCTRKR